MTSGEHERPYRAPGCSDCQSEESSEPSPFGAANPLIREVLDLRTGRLITHHNAIGGDYSRAIKLRMRLRQAIAQGTPAYACPVCGVPLHLVSRPDRRVFFFRHLIEDGRCSQGTRAGLSEAAILARKYDGVRESEAHARLKAMVAESLSCDARFTDIEVEARVDAQDRSSWRKPDVSAMFKGRPVAFEIQLSTTFLSVIAERRAFYQREGYLLVWVFKHFDTEDARLTQDDIFYTNNCNLFLASPATLKASRLASAFMLDCHWTEPVLRDGAVEMRWRSRLVPFDELTIDREQQRVFLYDWDRAVQALRAPADDPALRLEFEAFWLARRSCDPYDPKIWDRLRHAFRARGLELPPEPNWGGSPGHLLNAIYAAREGKPVGWRHRKLVHLARHVAERHKRLLWHFLRALEAYGHARLVMDEDEDGCWTRKLAACKPCLDAGDPAYAPDRRHDPLVAFLFPEMGGMIDRG